jgi:hypothetical protein
LRGTAYLGGMLKFFNPLFEQFSDTVRSRPITLILIVLLIMDIGVIYLMAEVVMGAARKQKRKYDGQAYHIWFFYYVYVACATFLLLSKSYLSSQGHRLNHNKANLDQEGTSQSCLLANLTHIRVTHLFPRGEH